MGKVTDNFYAQAGLTSLNFPDTIAEKFDEVLSSHID